jgi:hypothetical protein
VQITVSILATAFLYIKGWRWQHMQEQCEALYNVSILYDTYESTWQENAVYSVQVQKNASAKFAISKREQNYEFVTL